MDAYYERFTELSNLLKWPEESRVMWFVSGLKDAEVRKFVQIHGNVTSVEEARTCARNVTTKLLVSDAMRKRREKEAGGMNLRRTGSVSVARKSGGESSSPSVSSTKRVSFKRQASTGRGRSPSVAAAASTTSSTPKTAAAFSGEDLGVRKAKALKWLKTMGLSGCAGCLQRHWWKSGWQTCTKFCPFCGSTFQSVNSRHFASECPRRPSNKNDVLRAIKNAENRFSRQK